MPRPMISLRPSVLAATAIMAATGTIRPRQLHKFSFLSSRWLAMMPQDWAMMRRRSDFLCTQVRPPSRMPRLVISAAIHGSFYKAAPKHSLGLTVRIGLRPDPIE